MWTSMYVTVHQATQEHIVKQVGCCANSHWVKKAATMLATSKNVPGPGAGADDGHFNYHPSTSKGDTYNEGSSAPVVSRWLEPGNRTFLEVASMMAT